jgi:hypothetical protein
MTNSTRGTHWLAAAFVAVALYFSGWAVHAETAAMATDVVGGVTVSGSAGKSKIAILGEIEAGTRLQLVDAARLVVIYLKSGDEYAMSGPGLIEFRANEPVAISGAAPAKRGNPLGKSGAAVRIKPIGVAQGAMVMRSARPAARIKLLGPIGPRILERVPEFRWQAVEPGLRYQFELEDETGRVLFEVQVEGVAFKLPASIDLKEDAGYTWAVSVRLTDGRRYMNSGNFTIAPADVRARVEAMRPASAAPVSERVVFAAWLEQAELKDEARKIWRALVSERPEDARLKELAAE